MEIKDEIAAWVRTARKHAELSGEALGRELALELRTSRGNTKGNISHWELGKHQPSIAQLLAISKITGYPLPPAIREQYGSQTDDFKMRAQKVRSAATAGYEYFFNHVATALNEREVPPHIQSAIITLLDTCPLKAKSI